MKRSKFAFRCAIAKGIDRSRIRNLEYRCHEAEKARRDAELDSQSLRQMLGIADIRCEVKIARSPIQIDSRECPEPIPPLVIRLTPRLGMEYAGPDSNSRFYTMDLAMPKHAFFSPYAMHVLQHAIWDVIRYACNPEKRGETK